MLRQNFLLLLVLLVTVVNVNTLETSENDVTLEDIVKQVLKISPPDEPIGEFHEEQQPPKHMLELYHRFTAGRRASGETVRSITPNIDYTKKDENSHSSNALTFTLSHIADNEEVRLAQLVLRRRRNLRHSHPLHRKLLPPPYRVRVFQIVEAKGDGRIRSVPLASVPVPQVTRGGWHSLDITSAVRELLLSSSTHMKNHILGIRFEAPRSKVISPSHFLDQRDNTSSFLMLFTEESKDNEVKHDKPARRLTPQHIQIIQKHINIPRPEENEISEHHVKQRHHNAHHSSSSRRTKENNNPRRHKNKNNIRSDDDENSSTDIKELIDMDEMQKLKRHKKLFESFDLKYDDERESENRLKMKNNLINELLENSETKRVIRSVDPNDEEDVDDIEAVGDDDDEEVKRKRNNRSHKRRSVYDNEVPYEKLHIKSHSKTLTTTEPTEVVTDAAAAAAAVATGTDEEEDDKNLIPYPPGMGKKKKRKWRRGKRKNHGKTTKQLPDEWNKDDLEQHHRLHMNSSSSNQSCARRHLVVNFKELGWSDWVIAPKLFNAHYCAGSCSFPVPANVPVTNHAIIQSLFHDRRLRKGVPAPCCVPHSMSPLTILYLQDNNHVILRNYRSMTVETCGCR